MKVFVVVEVESLGDNGLPGYMWRRYPGMGEEGTHGSVFRVAGGGHGVERDASRLE